MPQDLPPTGPIYSTLAGDPDLREIVDQFVQEMSDRIAAVVDRMEANDWEGLRRLAHQLKGAAGSYGFEAITPLAARLEVAIREAHPEDAIRRAVESLVSACRRARATPPA